MTILCIGNEDTVKERCCKSIPPWNDRGTMPAFGCGHHKSAARTSTLHLIVSLFLQDRVDLKACHPELHDSFLSLQCANLAFNTDREQVFHNFQVSARGSIRKAPNVISWVVTLKRMSKRGDSDTPAIVNDWNQKSSKAHKLVGAKAQAVKNVYMLPDRILALIVKSVSRHGFFNCPYSEDNLSSKKLAVGYQFRSGSHNRWLARQVTSEESILNSLNTLTTCTWSSRSVPGPS